MVRMGKEDSRIQASGDSFMPGEFFPIVKSNRMAAVAVRFKQGLDDPLIISRRVASTRSGTFRSVRLRQHHLHRSNLQL